MSKVIALCGKLCSGKTHYSRMLQVQNNAVILSTDEIFFDLFHHQEGPRHDEILADIQKYLHKKALEITGAGCNVILDWGLWRAEEREAIRSFYRSHGVEFQLHYIDISDSDWQRNIALRNQAVLEGQSTDYYVDDGLLRKMQSLFEPPTAEEIDVRYSFSENP